MDQCAFVYSDGERCTEKATQLMNVRMEGWHCWIVANLCLEHATKVVREVGN